MPPVQAYRPLRAGFTLLELIIAITVLTVIVAIVYESFASVADTTDKTRTDAAEMRLTQFLQRNLYNNFMSTYSDPAMVLPQYHLFGTDEDGAGGAADTIEFCTTTPLMGGKSLPGALKMVRYAVVDQPSSSLSQGSFADQFDKEDHPRYLESSEIPLVMPVDPMQNSSTGMSGFSNNSNLTTNNSGTKPTNTTTSGSGASSTAQFSELADMFTDLPTPSWTVPIRSFDVTYFDGQDWQKEWDSVAMQRLPWCVYIKINLAKPKSQAKGDSIYFDPKEDPDIELMIPLPAAAGVITPGVTYAQYPEFRPPSSYYAQLGLADPNDPNAMIPNGAVPNGMMPNGAVPNGAVPNGMNLPNGYKLPSNINPQLLNSLQQRGGLQ